MRTDWSHFVLFYFLLFILETRRLGEKFSIYAWLQPTARNVYCGTSPEMSEIELRFRKLHSSDHSHKAIPRTTRWLEELDVETIGFEDKVYKKIDPEVID